MRLAKKNRYGHIDAMKIPNEADPENETFEVNDVKVFAIIATMISPQFQSLVRSATVLRNTNNRIQMRRQVHNFRMENGGNALEHHMKFDEIYTKPAAVGDSMDQDGHIILSLGSLSD
uniref:AlNc14C331G10692 protein n=1 Tax=Albugo laibachii Nc14 TaxID=890382 RepID=F0WWS9_9STRA|nr:AlNc14C331G10692 [Albugo laibachii Nc14]|eukprot:CCA25906.1 AlNc14C331G10692 [Albugo laibachii Nc14]